MFPFQTSTYATKLISDCSHQFMSWLPFSAKDVCGNFVLLLTVAHGRAFQRIWRSEQRCRGFTSSITTFCVLTITGLLLFIRFLYRHSGFYPLAGNHFSHLTDLSGSGLRFSGTLCTPSPAAFLQTFAIFLFVGPCLRSHDKQIYSGE